MEISERARLRRRAGLTQLQLGRRVGMSGSQICLWERGEIDLSGEEIERIGCVLDAELRSVPIPASEREIVRALGGTVCSNASA